jgi:hypothetical protein
MRYTFAKERDWHNWFAWKWVWLTESNEFVFFEMIQRRSITSYLGGPEHWEYRELKIDH